MKRYNCIFVDIKMEKTESYYTHLSSEYYKCQLENKKKYLLSFQIC